MFGLISGMENVVQATETIGFNTDSIIDLATGDVKRGYDGKWYCRGGFGPALSGTLGMPQQYKSTVTASLAMRMCSIYQTEFIVFDSEDAIIRNKQRILDMAGEHKGVLSTDNIIALDAKNRYDIESMRDLIKEIGEKKKAMGKGAMITTPFLDDRTGQRVKVYQPTIMLIDSWSQLSGNAEKDKIEAKGLDDPASATLAMKDANLKTQTASILSRYASQYGIVIMSTAHYGQKLNLDPYAPSPKALPNMPQNFAPKNVGGKYMFLTSPQLRINSCLKLQDDAKQCRYKKGDTNPVDLNELILTIDRCKNNASGLVHPVIVSQANGFLSETTDYHYIRQTGKGYSMTGNNVTHQPFLMPDVNLTRNSFRTICDQDRRVIRALQIGAQLLYVQNNWNQAGWQFPIKVDPNKLVEVLLSDKNKMTADRILASRGYWLPEELINKETPEYMSVFDILEFAYTNGTIKPDAASAKASK